MLISIPCDICGTGSIYARGICYRCYNRLWRRGELPLRKQPWSTFDASGIICAEPGCTRLVYAQGHCRKHQDTDDEDS